MCSFDKLTVMNLLLLMFCTFITCRKFDIFRVLVPQKAKMAKLTDLLLGHTSMNLKTDLKFEESSKSCPRNVQNNPFL